MVLFSCSRLQRIVKNIRDKHGWEYLYYGNVAGAGRRGGAPAGERRWATFDHRPRFNNNYIGLRNRFAVLSEAYAYLSFQDRILATSRFIVENLSFIHANADRIKKIAAAADAIKLPGQPASPPRRAPEHGHDQMC